jgi:hypothetical protein
VEEQTPDAEVGSFASQLFIHSSFALFENFVDRNFSTFHAKQRNRVETCRP